MTELTPVEGKGNFWDTGRIRLRAIEPGDAETFYRWNLESERGRMLDFLWPPTSLALQQEFCDQETKKRLENGAYHWMIETSAGIPVGTIDTHDCDQTNGTFSYGIDIAPAERGKGYAGEAILLVVRYYFDQLRYQKVTVPVHADNPASIRLHEKLGFQREGTLRRMAFQNGHYIDVHYYGLTVEEFHTLHTRA